MPYLHYWHILIENIGQEGFSAWLISVRLLFRQPPDFYFDINVNANMSNELLDLLKKVNGI